jgi:hypothetical protein
LRALSNWGIRAGADCESLFFWNQSDIANGRLRIPDVERELPADCAYDARRNELRLDADEMMSRMKRRVDGVSKRKPVSCS